MHVFMSIAYSSYTCQSRTWSCQCSIASNIYTVAQILYLVLRRPTCNHLNTVKAQIPAFLLSSRTRRAHQREDRAVERVSPRRPRPILRVQPTHGVKQRIITTRERVELYSRFCEGVLAAVNMHTIEQKNVALYVYSCMQNVCNPCIIVL